MGFFEGCWNVIRDIGELKEILVEGKEEIKEIATNGFKEIVIDGNSNYKTSFEKQDSASSRICKAEGSYEKAVDLFKTKAKVIDTEINDFETFVVDILNKSLAQWITVVEDIDISLVSEVLRKDYKEIKFVKPQEITLIVEKALELTANLDKPLYKKPESKGSFTSLPVILYTSTNFSTNLLPNIPVTFSSQS